MAVGFQINGLDAVLKRSEDLVATLKKDVQEELNIFANAVSRSAKDLVKKNSSDEGHLLGAINPVEGHGNLEASVVAAVGYAAFIEFGTRKFAASYVATLPADWQTYAASFKGQAKTGDFYDFLNAILDWVIRKGIASRFSVKTQKKININLESPKNSKDAISDRDRLESTAYAIALTILRHGIRPKPFLYPSVNQHKPDLTKRLENILNA